MEGQSAVSMVLQQIHSCNKRPLLVAIDGRCGAGKTTLAALLKKEIGCNVIHMDHFFYSQGSVQESACRSREVMWIMKESVMKL